MNEVVNSIRRVSDITDEISAARIKQSAGVMQVGERRRFTPNQVVDLNFDARRVLNAERLRIPHKETRNAPERIDPP